MSGLVEDSPDISIAQSDSKITTPKKLENILAGVDLARLPGYLRISLLEACNQACFFCHNEGAEGRSVMINPGIMWSAIDASYELGKKKFKFTGGEPTLHPSLVKYVKRMKQDYPDSEVGIITNGTRLTKLAQALYDAGLDKLNMSLHSLDREVYRGITGKDELALALAGLDAADAAGFKGIILNAVITRQNMDSVPALVDFAKDRRYSLRLLDYMPQESGVASDQIIPNEELRRMFPQLTVKPKIYHPKCVSCDYIARCGEESYLRLSASGELYPCMPRQDMKIALHAGEPKESILGKVALGFRRVVYNDGQI